MILAIAIQTAMFGKSRKHTQINAISAMPYALTLNSIDISDIEGCQFHCHNNSVDAFPT